ncbi:MAG TPA: hypothetical protein G4N96_08960 [Chloroflexi bacterium]|nr:hypothetical protein [Chloroflexota bacterium]
MTNDKLAQGIQAAKNGDKVKARELLYAVADKDPRNEMVWMWLSYAMDTAEDRQICLENALTINPTNQYALRGLAQISNLTRKQPAAALVVAQKKGGQPAKLLEHQAFSRPWSLMLVTAFWFGLGLALLATSVADIIVLIFDVTQRFTFLIHITPSQLWMLSLAIFLLSLGILLLNAAGALYLRHQFGYYASLIFALTFTLVGPAAIAVSERPNYLLAAFAAIMPTMILFLTLMSQGSFEKT